MPSFSAKRSTSSDGLNCLSFTRYVNGCFPDVKAAITHCGLKRLLRSSALSKKLAVIQSRVMGSPRECAADLKCEVMMAFRYEGMLVLK